MSDMQIYNLFPTPVMRVEGFFDEDSVDSLCESVKHNASQLNSNSDLLSHTLPVKPNEVADFKVINELAYDFLRDFGFLLFGENLEWSIKEMWTNVLANGGHQSMHSHANSFISGVVYLTDSDDSAKTVFHKPMGGNDFVFSNNHAESQTTPYNGDRWVASDVKKGDLILFPSYMLHAVPHNEGSERVTIAFNATPNRLKSWDYEIKFSD